MHDFQFETNFTAREFAKVKQHDSFFETGALFDVQTRAFSPWKFDSAKENPQGNISLTGEAFAKKQCRTRSLCDVLDDAALSVADKLAVVKTVCAAIADALEQDVELPLVGAGGTFLAFSEDAADKNLNRKLNRDLNQNLHIEKILFLPEKFYALVLDSFSKERQTELLSFWHIPVIKEKGESLRFACNAYFYAALTGFPPFCDKANFIEDFIDAYCLPLPWANIAEAESEIAHDEAQFLHTCENFKQARLAYLEENKKKIRTKRFLRKNRGELIIAACAALAVAAVAFSVHSDKLNDKTTLGLTDEQTIEVFYSAANLLNPTVMQEAGYRLKHNELENSVVAMYATSKMREAYSEHKIINPASWAEYGLNDKHLDELRGKFLLFGIIDLKINGKTANAYAAAPIKKESAPIQDGSGNGEKASWTLTYCTVFFSGDSEKIEKSAWQDAVELTFVKNRWRITAIAHQLIETQQVDNLL
ncbi:MAG: hypothetical protein Ta2A_24980 [Treponemataceae bacterium]|nr:MAG: hypothetical protein Ta2A_24980 [Treponemataceae bacterium]